MANGADACLSLAFVIYTLIVTLLHLYATTGRHAPGAANGAKSGPIELEERAKWYAPVPNGEQGHHVIGDDD